MGVGRPLQLPALRASGVPGPHQAASSSVASLGPLGPGRDTRWGRDSTSGLPLMPGMHSYGTKGAQ